MPELPEVETIRRGLAGLILKEKIERTEVLCAKSFRGEPVEGEILALRRRGKALLIDLAGGETLLIHLRMTGQLIFEAKGARRKEERFAAGHPNENFVAELPNKQTRVIFYLSNGTLYFNDQRKFGFIQRMKTAEVEKDGFIRRLAKEPWEMTGEELAAALVRHKKAAIKAVILDQEVMAGLGNIYADEALFRAGIHPERRAGGISLGETEKLLEAAKAVMEKSIELGGSTMRNYVKADGTRGNYLDLFAKVYGRDGEKCLECGAEIQKIKVGGRGTHFCPQCQRRKDD